MSSSFPPTKLLTKPTRRQWLTAASCAVVGAGWGLGGAVQAQELFDLEKVRASGILKVALYKDNAPYSDGKGQDMDGVDVALAQALARTPLIANSLQLDNRLRL